MSYIVGSNPTTSSFFSLTMERKMSRLVLLPYSDLLTRTRSKSFYVCT